MPRVKLFNREDAKQKAMELFWEKGYASTSLSDLTAYLNIGKGSFYDTFQSKYALFEECFDLYRNTKLASLEGLLQQEPDVKIGVRKMLELNLEQLLLDDKHRGCFISNTCSEFGGSNEILKTQLQDHFSKMREILFNYLESGNLNQQVHVESLTNILLTFLLGMNQESKLNIDKDQYLLSIENLLKLLD